MRSKLSKVALLNIYNRLGCKFPSLSLSSRPTSPGPSTIASSHRKCLTDAQVQLDKTEFPLDNKFAGQLVSTLETGDIFPKVVQDIRLCERCQQVDLCQPMFSLEDTLAELDLSRAVCDFCKMRWEVCHHLDRVKVPKVLFQRQESMLKLNESSLPVLTLCCGLGLLFKLFVSRLR